MFRLLFMQFLRARMVAIALLALLLTGIVSLFIGRQFMLRQEKAIAAATKFQEGHIARYTQYNKDDFGLLMYYLRFTFINQPQPLAALSIGQRDVNLSVQSVTIRALEAQKYDTDLNNPYNLRSGNLDLSFVIIYLFPLLLIGFTFNLLSEEKEGGTWQLLSVQARMPWRYLLAKMLVRLLTVAGVLLLLLALALPLLRIPFDAAFLLFTLSSFTYLLFWAALCWLIVTLHRSSGFNALVLLSVWVTLTVLLPAAVNTYLTNRYPVPEAMQTILKNRDGYHKKWDMDKSVTMKMFYDAYPQFTRYALPNKTFSWLWYYAMWHAGDQEAAADARQMRQKILQREKASRNVAYFIPTLHTQLQLNDMAETGMRNHLAFLDSTTVFHEKKRLHFYPKIFEAAPVQSENWHLQRPVYCSIPSTLNPATALLPVVVITILLVLLSVLRLRRV